ncbi:hypothetical protein [Streptomyces puniciscabiei]|uniref:hypothetical protein n=1 Tax=Streptomyces puniciscabiei TaxID=164348 RepID=UPI0037B653A9
MTTTSQRETSARNCPAVAHSRQSSVARRVPAGRRAQSLPAGRRVSRALTSSCRPRAPYSPCPWESTTPATGGSGSAGAVAARPYRAGAAVPSRAVISWKPVAAESAGSTNETLRPVADKS